MNGVWQRLAEAVLRWPGAETPGGKNYMHPLLGFNDQEGRTREDVIGLLRQVAAELDPEAARPGAAPEPAPEPSPEPTEPLPKWNWDAIMKAEHEQSADLAEIAPSEAEEPIAQSDLAIMQPVSIGLDLAIMQPLEQPEPEPVTRAEVLAAAFNPETSLEEAQRNEAPEPPVFLEPGEPLPETTFTVEPALGFKPEPIKPVTLATLAEKPTFIVPSGPTSSRMPPIGWGE
jgi:hypothetical protein